MENASKALIIAGGMLIALLVIGALLFMFNQLGDYGKTQDNNVKYSQLADFNTDFERYCDDRGVKGTDIISLINKIIDYNTKARKGGVNNSVDYNIKMSITVSNLNGFETRYPVSDTTNSLFKNVSNGTLIIDNSNRNRNFKERISIYSDYENRYTLAGMSKLSSSYDSIIDAMEEQGVHSVNDERYKEIIKRYTGIDLNRDSIPSLDEINQYRQYSEFKRAKFSVAHEPQYENGQIKDLYFMFDE